MIKNVLFLIEISDFQVKKLEEIVVSMKSTYEIKLEALQKDLETEKAERKKLEDQLKMAGH